MAIWDAIRERLSIQLPNDDDDESYPAMIARSSRNVSTYWRHYEQNPIIRAAVVESVHALIGIPLVAEAYDPKSSTYLPLPATDRLQMLLRRPSRSLPAAIFWGKQYTDLSVTGNFYVRKLRTGGRLSEFERMSPQHSYPKAGSASAIAEYVYNPRVTFENGRQVQAAVDLGGHDGDIRLAASDVIHIPLDPDPSYDLIGLSPIASALKHVDLHNAITEFTTSVMERNGVLDHALITKNRVTDREARRIERRWLRRRAGPRNAGGLAVIDGTEADLKQMGLALSGREMALTDLEKQVEALILMAMDVPPIVVGAVVGIENATYSNYMQARLAFHEESTDPNLWRLCSALEHGLAGEFPEHGDKLIRIRPDLSRVMALLDWEDQRRRLALAEFSGSLTTQTEARGSVDRPALPGGNFYVLPLNMKSVEPKETPPEDLTAEAGPDVQATAMNGAQIASLLEIVTAVATGTLPKESARGMIAASFPALTADQISAILDGLDEFEPEKPEPSANPFGAPPVPPTPPDPDEESEDDDEDAEQQAGDINIEKLRRDLDLDRGAAVRRLSRFARELGAPEAMALSIALNAYAFSRVDPNEGKRARARRIAEDVRQLTLRNIAANVGKDN